MKLSNNKFSLFLLFTLLISGLFFFRISDIKAVGNAYFPQETTVALDVGNFSILGGSDADTVTTSNTQITVTISNGQSFVLESSGRKLLLNDSGYSYTCFSDKSSIIIDTTTTKTVIITPSSTSCGSADNTGGGGGGGGGTFVAQATPVPSPTPVPLPISGPLTKIYNFTRNLFSGLQGNDVKALQDYLTTAGHFKYTGGSTGIFGPVTQTALAAWQKDNGVFPASGFWGPVSRAKYSELILKLAPQPSPVPTPISVPQPAGVYNFTRNLYVGLQGNDVKALQDYLTTAGHFKYAGGSTGYFGSVTQTAVAAWQAANGVSPAVGYFGPKSNSKYKELMGF